MSFTIFEDESANLPMTVSSTNETALKHEKRQFGTVLTDVNRDILQPKQPLLQSSVTSSANWSGAYIENGENCSQSLSDSDSQYDSQDFADISAPLPSPILLGEEPCQSTSLLLSDCGYFDEISSYIFQLESKSQCKPNYMSKQRDLSHSMRTVLVDWLVEVTDEYKLQRRTLFLAVAFMDRFLSEMSVLRTKLQLLGATCMFVASKFEEIYPPEAAEFAYLTEDTYSVAQILKLERLVLRVLDYQLSFPTTDVMTDRIIAAAHLSQEQATLINYISELSIVFAEPFLQYLPSVVASACVCLSNICMGRADGDLWPEELQRLTGKKTSDFYYCLVLLGDVMHQAPKNTHCKSVISRYKTAVECLPDRERIAALQPNSQSVTRDTLRE